MNVCLSVWSEGWNIVKNENNESILIISKVILIIDRNHTDRYF